MQSSHLNHLHSFEDQNVLQSSQTSKLNQGNQVFSLFRPQTLVQSSKLNLKLEPTKIEDETFYESTPGTHIYENGN